LDDTVESHWTRGAGMDMQVAIECALARVNRTVGGGFR
jgi:hypothetical protein